MEKSLPSKLANLKELVHLLSLSVQIQTEVSSILDEISMRIYSLEQDRERLLADYRECSSKLRSLERRYSELLYKFSELRPR